ncbi:MAG: ATP-binding cassette domain-containing protein [Treponema sp.]|nr:ATP-binding cassette domain-containing protein [Treponema sp.]
MNVKLSGIELTYSYKKVLRGVDVEFTEGKIHALLGENGAGKSSLMKILTGFTRPTSGHIFLDDREVVFKKPVDSLKQDIACVYQRPYLSDSLSVKENLRVGVKPRQGAETPLNNPAYKFIEEIPLNSKVRDLSGDKRFFVAFTASLSRNPKVLILDEPTALLDTEQSEKLFTELRKLSETGMNIIVITHKPEDLKFCDDVTRLVEGVVAESSVDNGKMTIDNEQLVTEKEDLVELTTKKCYELRKKYSGRVAIIPTDRTYLASNPNLTITQLVCSTFTESRNPKIRKTHTEEIIRKAEINIRPEEKVFNLSGGMLQRLILERELYSKPEIIYLEDPFQGLDSVSVSRLYARLEECRENGCRIVIVGEGE